MKSILASGSITAFLLAYSAVGAIVCPFIVPEKFPNPFAVSRTAKPDPFCTLDLTLPHLRHPLFLDTTWQLDQVCLLPATATSKLTIE